MLTSTRARLQKYYVNPAKNSRIWVIPKIVKPVKDEISFS